MTTTTKGARTEQGEKLILVRLDIHQWHGRKFDRRASEEVAAANGADSDAANVGRYNKRLVQRDAMLPVQRAYTKLRNRHYHMTAPWTDDGVRVLPAELYFKYTQAIGEARRECENASVKFAREVYAEERRLAVRRLGTLFCAADYPSELEVERSFGVEVHFEPLPNPEDVRVWGVGEVAAREVEADVRASLSKAIDAAHLHVAQTLLERAQEFVEKVRRYDDGETKGLRETAVENLRDVVRVVLDGLNVKHDPQLADLARQLEHAIKNVDADKLRDGEDLRKRSTADVEALAKKFAGAFAAPRRAAQAGGAR